MDGGTRPPNRSPRVSPVDRLGRRISPVVLDAAEQIGRRAIEHAEKLLIDPAVAAGLLEEAAATVSRALGSPLRQNFFFLIIELYPTEGASPKSSKALWDARCQIFGADPERSTTIQGCECW
jgi:hypothetical protein